MEIVIILLVLLVGFLLGGTQGLVSAALLILAIAVFVVLMNLIWVAPMVIIPIGLIALGFYIPNPYNILYFVVLGLIAVFVFGLDKIRNLVP